MAASLAGDFKLDFRMAASTHTAFCTYVAECFDTLTLFLGADLGRPPLRY
jgi:hypothetical protein